MSGRSAIQVVVEFDRSLLSRFDVTQWNQFIQDLMSYELLPPMWKEGSSFSKSTLLRSRRSCHVSFQVVGSCPENPLPRMCVRTCSTSSGLTAIPRKKWNIMESPGVNTPCEQKACPLSSQSGRLFLQSSASVGKMGLSRKAAKGQQAGRSRQILAGDSQPPGIQISRYPVRPSA